MGTGLLVDISTNEVAAFTSLHVTLTISAPLLASSYICSSVFSVSLVLVVVID